MSANLRWSCDTASHNVLYAVCNRENHLTEAEFKFINVVLFAVRTSYLTKAGMSKKKIHATFVFLEEALCDGLCATRDCRSQQAYFLIHPSSSQMHNFAKSLRPVNFLSVQHQCPKVHNCTMLPNFSYLCAYSLAANDYYPQNVRQDPARFLRKSR